jgi:hypothetical protein
MSYTAAMVLAGSGFIGRTYRLNSIYDPDTTVGGTAALGWEEWQKFYNYYQVFGAKISLIAQNETPAGSGLLSWAGYYVMNNWEYANWATPKNQLYRLDPAYHCRMLGAPFIGGSPTIYRWKPFYVSLSKLENLNRNSYAANWEEYGADMNANPTKCCYVRIFADSYNGSVLKNSTTCFSVKITYYVKLWTRDQLPSELTLEPAFPGAADPDAGTTGLPNAPNANW